MSAQSKMFNTRFHITYLFLTSLLSALHPFKTGNGTEKNKVNGTLFLQYHIFRRFKIYQISRNLGTSTTSITEKKENNKTTIRYWSFSWLYWNPLWNYENNFQRNYTITLTDFAKMNQTRKKIDEYLKDLRNNQDFLEVVEKKLKSDSKNLEILVTHNSELQKNMKVVQSKINLLRTKRSLLANNCRELQSKIKR